MSGEIVLRKKTSGLYKGFTHVVLYGGRSSGKSWDTAIAIVIRALQKKEFILCGREFQAAIRDSSKKLLEDVIRHLGFEDYFEIQRDLIYCKTTKTEIIFKGLWQNASSLKSMEGVTICWIEEANYVSQSSIDDLFPTVLRKEGSQIWLTFNRRYLTDPIDKMFLQDGMYDTFVQKVNYYDNKHLSDVTRKSIEWIKERDIEKYNHVWLGEPVRHSKAQIFAGHWRVSGEYTPTDDTIFYLGADWGFSQHPTVLIKVWLDEAARRLVVEEELWRVGVEIDHLPRFFDGMPGSRKWKIRADSARPETISYVRRQGFKIEKAQKGPNSVEEGIEFLKSWDIVVNPRCTNAIDEFLHYSYKIDRLTGEPTDLVSDKKNHVIDSIRYALEKVMFGRGQIFIG